MKSLVHFEAAKRELELAISIDEVRDIRDKAEALRAYCKQVGESSQMQNRCAEIKIRAERRAGEMLREMPKNPGGRATSNTLLQVGIGRMQSSRWQQVAAVPEPDFERHIAEVVEKEDELTSAGVRRLAKKLKQDEACQDSGLAAGVVDRCRIEDDLNAFLELGDKFGCIYADPAWQYGNQGTRAATGNHYGTMTVDEICALPVEKLAAEKAHLHLWTTNAFLEDSFKVIRAWGFEYRSVLIWQKPQVGIGNYWRVNHEYLMLGIRGGLQFSKTEQAMKARMRSVVEHSRIGHSIKPEIFADMVTTVSPGPYLEMFARRTRPNWSVWGNQVERSLMDNAE